jgi:tRNA-specific 2-thiouridylase
MICDKLGVEHFIIDVSKKFKENVIEYFVTEHKNNFTPSPCIICNKDLKIQELINFAKEKGIYYVATGHYGLIKKRGKESYLYLPKDKIKDQTYFLSGLNQEQLNYLVLPLGKMLKKDVYKFAKKNHWEIFLKTKQSQDFCFIANKSIPDFLRENVGIKKGNIIDIEGNILGKHEGLHFYTIGQRKGIELPQGPYYVKGFDIEKNNLIVTKNQSDLRNSYIELDNYNIINQEFLKKKIIRVRVKIRSQDKLSNGILKIIDSDRVIIELKTFKLAVSPGQFAVFYVKNMCLGCGRIIKAN